MAALDAALSGVVQAREVRVALLTGEAGAGKTRLASEFAARAEATLLWARAARFGEFDPLGLWAQALEGCLRERPDEEVRKLCGGVVADLAVLVRRAAALADPPAMPPPPRRLYEAVATILCQLGRDGPVLAVLDDVHLADASSWEALHYVTHGLRGTPVLIVATARAPELARQPGARQVLFGLEQEGRLLPLPVGAFDDDDLRALAAGAVGQAVPPALVRWLAGRSRGNVLLASGLLRALIAEGGDPGRPSLQRLPEELSARVSTQLVALAAPERQVVETLAVLGRATDHDTLAALLGCPRQELDRLLVDLDPTGLVVDRDGRVELDHPLFAEAIREQMTPSAARLSNRQAARTLLTAGRAAEAAPHFAAACEGRPDPEVLDGLCRALHEAEERQADQEALDVLDGLTRLLPPGDPGWAQVGAAMHWTPDWVVDHRWDNVAAGVRALQEISHVLAEADDLRLRASVALRLASFLGWGTGNAGEAAAACVQARGLAEQVGDTGLALLARTELAWARLMGGRTDLMRADALELVAAAEAAGDRFALTQACTTLRSRGRAHLRAEPRAVRARDAARLRGTDEGRVGHTRRGPHRRTRTAAGLGAVGALAGRATRGDPAQRAPGAGVPVGGHQPPPMAVPVLSLLAEHAAQAGDAATASAAAHVAAQLAADLDRPFLRAHAEPAAAAAAQSPELAAAAARQGLESLTGLDYPGLRGRLLVHFGQASAADRDVSIAALSEAAQLFTATGAAAERHRALESLRRLRGRGRRAADALIGPSSLTERELEVARLAGAGHTAAHIARDLYIGVRTVEGHLASIYAKLGVATKTELMRRAPELLP